MHGDLHDESVVRLRSVGREDRGSDRARQQHRAYDGSARYDQGGLAPPVDERYIIGWAEAKANVAAFERRRMLGYMVGVIIVLCGVAEIILWSRIN